MSHVQGCCSSTQRSPPSSPYGNNTPTGALPTDSRAPIATTEAQQHRSASSITPSSAAPPPSSRSRHTTLSRHNEQPQSSISSHPTKPLKPPPKASKIAPPPSHSIDPLSPNPRLTHAILIRERTAYFETRVAGHPEVWAALRLMCEMLERGDRDEAQAIMDAAGCTCPSGEVWGRRGGIWDERGERYVVPAWCVGVPKGTVLDGEGNEQEGSEGSGIEEEESSEDEGERKKKVVELDKGKGRLVEVEKEEEMAGDVKVRVRMSHTARDFVVRTRADAKVHTLLKRVREVGEIPSDIKIKIGYLGRILHEHETLEAQGWHEGHTLNVYVFE